MKSVMKSVSPRICKQVANGDCTILVSKTAPKQVPFKAYIYCTKGTPDNSLLIGKDGRHVTIGDYRNAFNCDVDGNVDWDIGNEHVVGEFVCDNIIEWQYDHDHKYYVDYPDDCTSYFPYLKCHNEATGLKCSELEKYGKGKPLYGWHISELKIYDKPKELSEFSAMCRYKNNDGSCQFHKVDCQYQQRDYNQDGSINVVECGRPITRAPQSWQYVEEL